jgi:hypothetical protein
MCTTALRLMRFSTHRYCGATSRVVGDHAPPSVVVAAVRPRMSSGGWSACLLCTVACPLLGGPPHSSPHSRSPAPPEVLHDGFPPCSAPPVLSSASLSPAAGWLHRRHPRSPLTEKKTHKKVGVIMLDSSFHINVGSIILKRLTTFFENVG